MTEKAEELILHALMRAKERANGPYTAPDLNAGDFKSIAIWLNQALIAEGIEMPVYPPESR